MRLGVCVLPEFPWAEAEPIWRRVEQLGFDSAWTYDHITWDGMPSGPWYGAWPTLTAAAVATSRVRLGALVSSANFRHPVPFAQEIMSLDDISGGRLTVGIGAGSSGSDAKALGGEGWPPKERAGRFAEFVEVLDVMLTNATAGRTHTTFDGEYYQAGNARLEPGCPQTPRTPFAIAATGPRGLDLAARLAQTWVCVDTERGSTSVDEQFAGIGALVAKLERACERAGRDPGTIDRLVLTGFGPSRPMKSVADFQDIQARYSELGFTDLVLHYPRPEQPFAGSLDTLEAIAALPR